MCFANKERLFSKMSRIKSRTQSEICGDCGASDPSWASINRGILLCAECCSVHRSLGRHISQVKSLRQGSWSASVLNLVNSLNAHGANGVWEHCLMDSIAPKNLRRKPLPKDPLHPIKSDFIRAKHVNWSFVLKPNIQQLEEDIINCSVISNNGPHGGVGGSAVVGSIGSGGGSNNTTAIVTNQINSTLLNCTGYGNNNTNASTLNNGIIIENELNKELHASVRTSNLETSLRLIVQGADPNYYHDEKGSTPLHVAVKSGQTGQIELLLVYGANILTIDAQGHTSIDIAKINKQNTIAERLIEALYEVTDRLCYFIGNRKPDHSTGKHIILPEPQHKEISEQLKIARGKLQLIPNKMFEELVMDIYDEVDRREMEAIWATSALNPEIGAVPFLPTNPHLSATRNQGRQKLARFSPIEFTGLVTDVLIDANRRQNMAALCPFDSSSLQNLNQFINYRNRESNLSDDEPLYDAVASDDDYAALATPITPQAFLTNKEPINLPPTQTLIEVETLRRKLEESSYKIVELQSLVQKLSYENNELKSRIEPTTPSSLAASPPIITDAKHQHIDIISGVQLKIDLHTNHDDGDDGAIIINQQQQQPYGKRPVSMFEPREGLYNNYRAHQIIPESRTTAASMYQIADGGAAVASIPLHLPQMDEIKRRTDCVTRCIQELWIVMQNMTRKDAFIPCSDKIRLAVADLSAIFSSTINDDTILNALQQLNQNTIDIHMECTSLQQSLLNDVEDTVTTDAYMQGVRNCAYNLAMATKMLVTQFS